MMPPTETTFSRADFRSIVVEFAALMKPIGHLQRCVEWDEEAHTVKAFNQIFGLTLPESITINLAIADRGCVVALCGPKDPATIPRLFVRYIQVTPDDLSVFPALIGWPDADERQIPRPWPPTAWNPQAAIDVVTRLFLLASPTRGGVQ
jgi:hypothetical protein